MRDFGPEFEPVFDFWAQRFQALTLFADRFGTVEGVQELISSWIDNDPTIVEDFINTIPIPEFPEWPKVFWVLSILEESINITYSKSARPGCYLKELNDMSPEERLKYFQLLQQFGYIPTFIGGNAAPTPFEVITDVNQKEWIDVRPGPLLDELKAAGLVDCEAEVIVPNYGGAHNPRTYERVVIPGIGFPSILPKGPDK